MRKHNLVLIHSYGTNSKILRGLSKYLDNYYNVYFIDLPGFIDTVPAIPNVTIEKLAKYVEMQIEKLDIDNYLVAGISFGFLVANSMSIDSKKCKAIIAMEPYINRNVLKFNLITRLLLLNFMRFISLLRVEYRIWRSKFVRELLIKISLPVTVIDEILHDIDAKTFIDLGKFLLTYTEEPKLKNIPYAVLMNKNDYTINYKKIYEFFMETPEKVILMETDMDHYPADLSEEYFSRKIPARYFNSLNEFIFLAS